MTGTNRSEERIVGKPRVSLRSFLAILFSKNIYSLSFLFILWGFYILFYYFGEIVDFFGWTALQWEIFYTVHDVHRAVFLIPIIYAGYVFGVKATLTVSIITLMAFIPRALFISPYPDPLLRMLLFMVIATLMGYLTAIAHVEFERRNRLQALLRLERDRLLGILERMEDGVIIVGPDYRIRFMNPSMIRDFGNNIGTYCYKSLFGLDKPCQDICRLNTVIDGGVERWQYKFPDDRTYEVQASPYRDTDGASCQLTIYRKITTAK